MSGTKQRIVLEDQEKRAEGELEISTPSAGARLGRGALTFLAGLLATGVMALVPILHFVLVPIGAIMTVFLTRRAVKTTAYITGGSGTCPACSASVRIFPRKDEKVFTDICDGCKRALVVRQL